MRKGFGCKKEKESKNTTPIEFDAEMAHLLYNTLKKHKRLPRTAISPSIKKWSDQFRILRKSTTEGEIRTVLKWYGKHLKDPYTPQIQSAQKFRTEFQRIVDSMNRHGPELLLQNVQISDKAQVVAKRYTNLQWPHNEGSMVPVFCQLSLDNFAEFEYAIKTLFYKYKLEADLIQQKKREAGELLSTKDRFMENLFKVVLSNLHPGSEWVWIWLQAAHFEATKSPSWDGNLLRRAFNYESKRFQLICAEYIAEYRGDGAYWYSKVWPLIQEFIELSRKEPGSKGNMPPWPQGC